MKDAIAEALRRVMLRQPAEQRAEIARQLGASVTAVLRDAPLDPDSKAQAVVRQELALAFEDPAEVQLPRAEAMAHPVQGLPDSRH